MFLEILLAILIGVTAGTFTGLIPGIHTNLVALFTVSLASSLLKIASLDSIIVFIISFSITHSFLNVIPSIFLGAPEGSTALSVLPGHKMLMDGEGVNAVKCTLVGSLLGLLTCFFLYKLLEFLISNGYPLIENYIGELLLITGFFIILRTNDKLSALIVYLLSGTLGYFALNSRVEEPLFPLLSGLFGVAILIFSLKTKSSYPVQLNKKFEVNTKESFKSVTLGSIAGFITSVLPGLGSSTAAAITSVVKSENETRTFLVLMGSISTVNFFCSIAALSVINKARNGSIVAIQSLTANPNTYLLIMTSLMAGGISIFLANILSNQFSKIITKISYSKVVFTVILLITIMTILLSSFIGLYILLIGTIIGLYANHKGIPKNVMMSCIMFPIMLFFF